MGYSLKSFTKQVKRQEKKKERYWKKIHRKYHKKRRFSFIRWFKHKLAIRKMKREMKLSHSVKYAHK